MGEKGAGGSKHTDHPNNLSTSNSPCRKKEIMIFVSFYQRVRLGELAETNYSVIFFLGRSRPASHD